MNLTDNQDVVPDSFAYNDLFGIERWIPFTVVFGSLTVIGATTYTGRIRWVGKAIQFQVEFSAATSIASVAGTSYFTIPVPSVGLTGEASMTNKTTKVAVGVCVVDGAAGKVYLPTQVASANTFWLAGWCEVP